MAKALACDVLWWSLIGVGRFKIDDISFVGLIALNISYKKPIKTSMGGVSASNMFMQKIGCGGLMNKRAQPTTFYCSE
jgi:hypothetical protein